MSLDGILGINIKEFFMKLKYILEFIDNKFPKDQISCLTEDQIRCLTKDQISWLSGYQIIWLTENQIKLLKKRIEELI